MFNLIHIKKNFILFLFSISIFFSFVNLSFLELRFSYLISLLFIFFEKKFLKLSYRNILILILTIFLFLLVHLILNNIIIFNSIISHNFFLSKSFLQIFIISISVFIIYFYKDTLLLDLKKLFDYFLIIFTFSIFFYNIIHRGILFDTLYKCDLGFFYYTKFIFFENSHFGIIAISVILNFIYNFEYYLRSKVLFLLNILFIIFTFGNFSLTFYLGSLFSLILIFVCFSRLEKYKLILLILFFMVSNFFLFYGKQFNQFFEIDENQYCVSNLTNLEEKYKLGKNKNFFNGKIVRPIDKISNEFLTFNKPSKLKRDIINFSVGVHLYSLYVAKEALLENPLGYGVHNYKNFREIVDKKMKIEDGYHVTGIISLDIFSIHFRIPNVLDLNLNSGSNNFSKIIVEFGLFGIVIFIFYSLIIFSRNISDEVKFSLFPLIFTQLLVRGTGYFQSGFLIITIILILIVIDNFFKNEK